eukprot:TRINITY_DN11211_c0_g1_i2.p1 TRINITY_DN11211_c0_g1~~TRINITY_DN11211_c0_g1_i2.p1  ORF type:complete len:205 (+),score=40.64 TRINITY_DN11211_c0_g1_i2:35-649(+)
MFGSPSSERLYVIKRNGVRENVMFDKITSRVKKLCYGLSDRYVDPVQITMKVISGIYPGVTTSELDNLAAEISATMATIHPDYAQLAGRIAVSNLHKESQKAFSSVIEMLYTNRDKHTDNEVPMVSKKTYDFVMEHSDKLNSAIIFDRDFDLSYFGFKTLERSYLLRINGKVVERPQHLFMRVAVGEYLFFILEATPLRILFYS